MTHSLTAKLKQHLDYLVGDLGPRPVASPAHRAAADYIREKFRRAGLRLEQIQIDCLDWRHHETSLVLAGEKLQAAANTFSPPCDIQGPLVPVCTLAELEAADIRARIPLFYGDLSNEPLIPLNCRVYNSERDQRINQILNSRKPAALLLVSPQLGRMDERTQDEDLLVPAATIPPAVGLQLVDLPGEIVSLRIEAERIPGLSHTILGFKEGQSTARVTLMAHYDTMTITPGALDNGAGTAALLVLAEELAGRDLPLGLEFIAFGDHEYYAYSDGEYVARRGADMHEIVLAVNMDLPGARLGTNNITLMSAGEELKAKVEGIVGSYPGVIWVDPWPESNHSTFAWRGVPSIALSSTGAMTLHHQPEDTLEWVSPAKLAEVVELVMELVEDLQDKTPAWARPGNQSTGGNG